MADVYPPHVRFVIRHTPGPAWQEGTDFREQVGIQAHVDHYRAVHERAELELGGPFLAPDMGGMMIPIEGLSEEAVRQIATSDPAVQAGLLRAEVLRWYTAMRRQP